MRYTKQTTLQSVRKPTAAEAKRGAEVAFDRQDSDGREYTVLACKCYESWEQWGAATEVLADNCDAVERWRHGGLNAFDQEGE